MDNQLIKDNVPFEYDHAERDFYEEAIAELAMEVKHDMLYKHTDYSKKYTTFYNSLVTVVSDNIFVRNLDSTRYICPKGYAHIGGGKISTSLVVRWSDNWQDTEAKKDSEKVEYAVVQDTRDYFLRNISSFSNPDEMAKLIELMG